jgi:hypothetical protein
LDGRILAHAAEALLNMRTAKLFLLVSTLAMLYWPGIRQHWTMAQNPYFVPYDAAQYIPAFFKFEARDPVPTTYAKEYYLDAICPPLYKGLLQLGAQFADVRHFQLGMMYLTYALFLAVMGRLGWLLGGPTLCFAVLALSISAWIFFGLGFIGGAPRMYGYPLMAVILYGLIMDRPGLPAVATVLGALLYPIIAVIGGSCLAGWMLLRPCSGKGVVAGWPLSRRLTMVVLTGVVAFVALVPLLLGSEPYGRRIVDTDIQAYPEAGPDGNYRPYDQLPYKLFGYEFLAYLIGPLYSHGDPIAPWLNGHRNLDATIFLVLLALIGGGILLVILRAVTRQLKSDSDGIGIRLISFFLLCAILHVLAWLAAPYMYIPARYFMFSLPFVVTLIFPWSLYTLLAQVGKLKASRPVRDVVFLAIIGAYLLALGGRGNAVFADAIVEKSAQPLFDAVATLPKTVVIAGWPVGPLRKLEYATRRNAFLTGDQHQVLHLAFLNTMRTRMDALFDAYFSTDAAPLDRLRRQFGVTHLIVDTRDFTDPTHRPEYFAPWRSRIEPRLREIEGKEYLMNDRLHKQAAVFNQNGLILLDLAKIP